MNFSNIGKKYCLYFDRDHIWLFIILSLAVGIVCIAWDSPPPLYRIYKLVNPMDAQHSVGTFYFTNPYEMPKPELSSLNWIYLVFCYVVVMLFGHALFGSFWTKWASGNPLARLFGAFFVGYLAVVSLARLFSLFIDSRKLHVLILVVMSATIFISTMKSDIGNFRKNWDRKVVVWCIAASLFITAALLLQVYQFDFTWHSHLGVPLSELQHNSKALNTPFFPITFNYYDTALFHYVITYPLADKIHVILPWWITLTIIKLSVFIFIYGIFCKIGMASDISLTSTVFLFFGTVSPIITRYYLLFDYGNPLFQESDISRIVGFAAFLIVVIIVADQQYKASYIAVCLFSIATASIVTSHTAWIVMAWLFVWFFAGDSDITRPASLCLDRFVCLSSVLAWTILFALPFNGYYVVRLIFCIIPVVTWLVRYFVNLEYFNWRLDRKSITAIAALASITFGLIFLGNIFIYNPLAKAFYSTYNIPSFSLYGTQGAKSVYSGNYSLGDFRDIYRMGLHAQFVSGNVGFFCFYGGILIMILFSQYWRQKSWKESPPDRMSKMLHEFFLVMVISLPLLFFFMNFINIGETAWYKIRFSQIPIIYIEFYFLFTISKAEFMRLKTTRSITIGILLLLCTLPFFATQRLEQMCENFKVIKAVFLK